MKKTILSMLTAFGCSVNIMAQTDDSALRINFEGTGNPVETEHLLEGVHITFSEDGEQMNLTVNNATVTYSLDDVSGMSHFSGTPGVALQANEDPDNEGNYYTTFYSSLEAYSMPESVKAYTAQIAEEDGETVVKLTALEGNVLPKNEAVLLYSDVSGDIKMTITEDGTTDAGNKFQGVDVATSQSDFGPNNYYMLSYGQNKLGFYKMKEETMLSANKAFIALSPSAQAKAMRMVFEDEDTGIDNINDDLSTTSEQAQTIYSISGVRQDKLQKGINIVNGKKMIIE